MAGAVINLSNRIKANTAGQTRKGTDVGEAPVATTAGEAGTTVFGGALDSLVAGGTHPEAVPGVAPTPLEKATNSVKGVLGGLKPSPGSVVTPGPSGATAAAKTVQAGTKAVTDATTAGAKAVGKFADRFRGKRA
jgi:hypothetical protein